MVAPRGGFYDVDGRWAVEGILSEWIVKSPFPYMSTAKDFFEDKGLKFSSYNDFCLKGTGIFFDV